jgi:gliding motility-associated-like protein
MKSKKRIGSIHVFTKKIILAFALLFFTSVFSQIEVSVPFNDGFIGLRGNNAQDATNIQRFSTLTIAKAYFVQTTSSGRFEVQGNDITGTLRLQLNNGVKIDIPGALVWRENSGNTNVVLGFLANSSVSLNLSAYGGPNYSIQGGNATGKSNFGFKLNGVTYTLPNTGGSLNGNAANIDVALLNTYLDARPRVISPNPANFVLSTANQDPGDFVLANFGSSDILLASVGLVNPPTGASFSFGTTTGLTRSTGYTSWTGLTRISFTGTQANINAALASLSVATGTGAGDIKLSVSATVNEAGNFYNPINGHFYKPVTGSISYTGAKTAAAAATYKGQNGYLVTVTSAVEQDFVNLNTTQNNIWIALSDLNSEGTWYIDAGPEQGRVIWKTSVTGITNSTTSNYLSSGTAQGGYYTNWDTGEPNNADGSTGEDHAVTKWNLGTKWNDLRDGNTSGIGGYLIEFGGWEDPDNNAFLDFYSASTTYVANCPSNQAPVAPTAVSAGTNSGAGTVPLVVSVASGTTVDWYASATGGTVLSGGQGVTSFTTPVISTTTTFYAQSRNTSSGCLNTTRTAVTATIVPCPNTAPNVRFKLSPPDVTTSAIQGQTGSRTENFNSLSLGNLTATGTFAVGAFTRSNTGTVEVKADDVWGGSGSKYLQAANSGEVSINLTDASRYVGFWWAAGNANNNVTIYGSCGGNEIQLGTFTAQTVLNLLSGATVTAVNGTVYSSSLYKRSAAANEAFAYINLELDDPTIYFTRIVFGGSGFEFDNITTAVGYGAASSTTPGAPTITSITRGTGTATINFTAPTSDGGQAITNYQYSIDGGTNWLTLSPADTTTPLVISGLNDATAYPIRIRAVNSIGGGTQSNSVNATTCTPPQVAAVTSQTVCNGAPTSVINFSPVNTAGYQWMTLNSIASGTASGTGQNGITVSITQTGGGLAANAGGMYDGTRFPQIYSVPTSGNQIRNTRAGVFTATFNTPVTNPLVAFASVGNPSTPVPVLVSTPFTPIWTDNTTAGWSTTYDLPNNKFTGTEGFNIIRIDGTVTTVSFNYTATENYSTMAFGFEDQNTTYNWTNDTPSIGLAASGTGNILPFNGINTGTTPVVATITVTPVTGGCAGTPRTFTITVNPSTTISYSSSSFEIAAGQAITPITPTTNGTSFAISPALPTGLSFNTSTGVISGTPAQAVIPGTYTITATLASTGCTGTTTLLLSDPSCSPFAAADFQTNGNATLSGNIYTLTPNQGGRNGSAWNKNRLFLDQDFDINARVYLGNSDLGADGIAFVLQNQSLNAGSSGGGLGYAGITPSFAVEFDTYNNGSIEPNQDHIAIIANGNTAGAHNTYSTPFEVQMEDGQWHTARFVWDATAKNFQVWYDGTRRHNITIDLKADIFNGRPYVYWGFTGATGGATNLQQVEFTTYCYVQQVGVTALAGTNNATAALAFCEGATVNLQASASTSYQWFKDGVAISGETGRELVVATAGAYTVEAITNQNTTLSEVVTVSVIPLPAIAYSASYSFERTKAITSASPTSTGGTVATYAISPALPSGLTFNTTTGVISGTPTAVSASQTYTVTGTTATASCVGTTTFTLEVFNAVAPSSLSYSPDTQTVRQNTAIEVMTPTISGGAPTYSISPALPAGLTINATTGVISGTLTATQTGSVTYTVTATNTGGSTTATVTLVYNTAPTNISLSASSINENNAANAVVGTLSTTDVDTGDTHTYTLVSGEGSTDNESFTIAENQLKATPVFDFETKTSYSVRIKTTDAGGLTYEKVFTITVNNVDESPILSVSQSSFYGVINVALPTIVVSNSGGTANSFAISPTLPAGLSFNTATGAITGTPTVLLTSREFTISGTNSDGTGSVTFALFIDLDTDGDGIGNQNDADMDGDGVSNTQEAIDGTDSLNSDTDGDGVIDGTEKTDGTDPKNGCKFVVANRTVTPSSAWNAADCDGDGLSNGTEGIVDTDRDGTPDYLDLDSDGDGILDRNDAFPKNPLEWTDTDRDGIGNNADTDDDNDGILDACDVDTNGDGIPDNGSDMDADGINDGCDTDKDGDGVNNISDNCPNSPNTDQADRDRDGKGDICDTVEINVSQAISPNGDGVNDTWVIYNLSNYPGTIVRVFNRWGKEVFYSNDYQNNWTGHYKDNSEKLPPSGSYFYQIDLKGDGSIDAQGWLYITQ